MVRSYRVASFLARCRVTIWAACTAWSPSTVRSCQHRVLLCCDSWNKVNLHDLNHALRQLRKGEPGLAIGAITRDQFITSFTCVPDSASVFDRFDSDGDRRNDVAELLSILILCADGDLAGKCTSVFQLYDFDQNGILSRSELVLLIRGTLRALAKASSSLRMPRLYIIEETVQNILEADPHDIQESVSMTRFTQWCLKSATFTSLIESIRKPSPVPSLVFDSIEENCIGGHSKSLGRIRGCWREGLCAGLNSADNPQFLLRLKYRSRARSSSQMVSIVLERDRLCSESSSSHTPMYLYLFRAKSRSSGRLLDLSSNELVAVTQAVTSDTAHINVKPVDSDVYIIMACLQIRNHTASFHVNVHSQGHLRPYLYELPFIQTRICKLWSGQHAKTPPISVQLAPKQSIRIDLIQHNSPAMASLDAEMDRGAKVALRSIDRHDRGRYLVQNLSPDWQYIRLSPKSSSTKGSFEIVIISDDNVNGRPKIMPSANSTVVGYWRPDVLRQILVRFVEPKSGLERVQFVLQLHDMRSSESSLCLCLYRVEEAIGQVNLCRLQVLAQSRFVSGTDSVSLDVSLATSQIYILVPIIDKSLDLTQFTVTCQSRFQDQLQLQLLPDLYRVSATGTCSDDVQYNQPQFLISCSTFVMVRIAIIADQEQHMYGCRLYRSGSGSRTAFRRKFLVDEDLLMESDQGGSVILYMEPRLTSSIIIVIHGPPGHFKINVTCSLPVKFEQLSGSDGPRPVVEATCDDGFLSMKNDSIVKVCERAELRFTDSEFIPSPSTLGYGIDDCLRGWMRMADIADQPRLFDEVIDLHDIEIHMKAFSCIVQALSALAVKTDLTSFLRRIFSTKQVSYWSVYNLNLYHIELQKWVQIVTDDYVPVDYSHQPYFVRYRDPEVIWLPLLVKALAKLHGSYKNLSEQTDVGRLLEILTGEKPLVLTDFDIDRIAVICPDPSFSILAIPHLSNTNIDLLLPWHQAYILSEIRQSNDGQIRLAVVRRIWGRFESFRGKWANESDLWTSVLKSDLGFDEIGTDSFFADPVELALMFKYVYIVRVPKPSNIFKFLTSQEGVWHKSLSNGIGSVHNPQWMFATKRVSVVIALSTGFRDRTHQATISLILCRIRGKLPLTDLNEQDIISKNDAEGSKCSQIEVTLPGSRSGKPALYGIIAWFGGLPGENLQAAFTLTVKSTERIFLSRSQFVTQELAADVLRNRPDILRIPTLIR